MIDNIENVLINGNLRYQWKLLQGLENIEISDKIPKYPILILTCIDPRIDVHRIFQLNPGDIFVLRNAGNFYTQDTLRAILLAIYHYDVEYIIILGHLDCGMTKINLLELKRKIPYEFFSYHSTENSDLFSEVREFFKPFTDELRNIKQQIEYLQKIHKYKPEVKITGMLYDTDTGWVFEYEKFKELAIKKNFQNYYKTILRDKKNQFIEFIKMVEDKNINKGEGEKYVLGNDLDEENEGYLQQMADEKEVLRIHNENFEKDITSVNTKNQKMELDRNFKKQMIMPKIEVPKIHFPGVKIYIPKISRKKNRNEIV